jgi:penicillin-binding protein 1C
MTAQSSPQIVSPLPSRTYFIRVSNPSSIGLRANNTSGKSIFWFANKSYIAKTSPAETFSWQPGVAGAYLIRAVDEQGNASSEEVNVEFIP